MSGLQRFNRLLLRLQFLVWFQKSLRMLVRSLWFAGAAYLLVWGLNRLVGFLPEVSSRWTVIVLLGILPLLRIPFLWPKLAAFTWRLDRQLGLKEQVSTAFQEVSRVNPDPIIPDLLDQAVRELKRSYSKVILKGWGLLPDLASLILVLFLLGGIYYTAGFSMNTGQPPPVAPIEKLPALMMEPSFSGSSAMDSESAQNPNDPNSPQDPSDIQDPEDQEDPNAEDAADTSAGDQAGDRELGPVTDLDRLLGQGDDFSLMEELVDSDIPGILMPGTQDQLGDQTAGGTSIYDYLTSDEMVISPLLPYTYPWIWRDVISSFFQPFE